MVARHAKEGRLSKRPHNLGILWRGSPSALGKTPLLDRHEPTLLIRRTNPVASFSLVLQIVAVIGSSHLTAEFCLHERSQITIHHG